MLDHEKMADKVVASLGGSKPGEPDGDEPDGDETEENGEEEPKAGHLGKMLAAAFRHGDGEAIEDLVCKIVEEHGGKGY